MCFCSQDDLLGCVKIPLLFPLHQPTRSLTHGRLSAAGELQGSTRCMEKSFPIEITSERVPEGSLDSGKDSQGEGGRSQTDWRKVPACGAAVRRTGITTLGCRVWMEGGGDETRSDSEHSAQIDF